MKKNSKYSSKYGGKFLFGIWQYWSNLRELTTDSLAL